MELKNSIVWIATILSAIGLSSLIYLSYMYISDTGVLINSDGFQYNYDSSNEDYEEYRNLSIKYSNNLINEYVYNQCEDFDDFEYLNCVNGLMKKHFNWKSTTKEPLKERKNLWEGDCESSSIYYANLLDRKGISNQFIMTSDHIFIIADLGNTQCILDQKTMKCW